MYENGFGLRLSKLRSDKGISARDMSLSIGQNPGYINSIETGKSLPSMSSFFYICEYLGVTPKEFFDTDNNSPALVSELYEDIKKLDYKQLQALTTIVSSMVRHV
ncbi:MAG: helix-turn-helix transcriptional regulator [Oscillospiraceae bacterium]|nr:helix-turn-helix transcriptional regulator [Oscillospiraceae bacterium]